MKIINSKDFYKVLLKTDFNSKCFIVLLDPMKFCPSCNLYFYSKVGDFCTLCGKGNMIIKNNFFINFHKLSDTYFTGIDLSDEKELYFNIDEITYFDNLEEQYFIVNI